MKRSELTISKRRREHMGGLGSLSYFDHWNVTTPDGRKYNINIMRSYPNGRLWRTNIHKGHYPLPIDNDSEASFVSMAKNYNDALRIICELPSA